MMNVKQEMTFVQKLQVNATALRENMLGDSLAFW